MAHYALLDENNVVVTIITGRNEDEIVDGVSDWEEHYGTFHNMTCKRTSYNTYRNEHLNGGVPFRGNYATIDGTYDPDLDIFIDPQPYPSWVFDEATAGWNPPTPRPDDVQLWTWVEDQRAWVLFAPDTGPDPNMLIT